MPETKVQVAGPEEIAKPTPLFEVAVLVSLAIAILALFLFAWIGSEMHEGDTQRFDLAVRAWVHRFASPGMTRTMTVFSLMGYNILIAELLAALTTFLVMRWRRAFLWLIISTTGSLLLDLALKYAFRRPRPVAFFGVAPRSYSFPSGHALVSFCFYLVLAGLLSARIKSLALRILIWSLAVVMVTMIGLSRIYLGVHYPSDVLAGYLAAAVWVGAVIVLDHIRKVRKSAAVAN
jgi:undecaprenyl-diphosphatase